VILFFQPPQCWDYRCASPVLFLNNKNSKHFLKSICAMAALLETNLS
jgi:hypothetical protein